MPSLWSWGMLCDFFLYKYSNAANTPLPHPGRVFFFSQSQSDAQHLYDKNENEINPVGFSSDTLASHILH